MKKFIITSLSLFLFTTIWAQENPNSVEYTRGRKMLNNSIIDYLVKHDGTYTGVFAYYIREGNKYFIVVIKNDKDGRIKDGGSVLSMQDTTNAEVVLNAVLHTNGLWINHTGVEKTVVLPIYFLYRYDDEKIKREKDPVCSNYFTNSNKDIICLEPLVIELHPWVR